MIIKDTASKDIAEFKKTLSDISGLYLKYRGISYPYTNGNCDGLKMHSTNKRQEIINDAKTYLRILKSTINNSANLNENKVSLWCALKEFSLVPVSDILEHVNNDDIVEIYTLQGLQIWRNFNFLKICGYTLEEIFTYSWEERYSRDKDSIKKVHDALNAMLAQTERVTQKISILNIMQEVFSQQKYLLRVLHKCLSPLFSMESKQIIGFIVISEVEILNSQPLLSGEEKGLSNLSL